MPNAPTAHLATRLFPLSTSSPRPRSCLFCFCTKRRQRGRASSSSYLAFRFISCGRGAVLPHSNFLVGRGGCRLYNGRIQFGCTRSRVRIHVEGGVAWATPCLRKSS